MLGNVVWAGRGADRAGVTPQRLTRLTKRLFSRTRRFADLQRSDTPGALISVLPPLL
jgi:hypothetical protein